MKKNIHLIPTVNPSRLYSFANKLYLDTIPKRYYKKYNICITDDSDIKEGYYLDLTHNIIMKSAFYPTSDKNGKKIILTTDPILIQSGVQEIPDDFLEWLVKNPSCEEVEIYLVELCDNCGQQYCDNSNCRGCKDEKFYLISTSENTTERVITYCDGYKVKEEPKQIYYNTVGRENGEFAIKGQFNTQKEALDLANELNRKFPELYYDWNETLVKEEPKQENNFFESLQKYFKDTPKEKVLEDWAKSAEFDNVSSGGESIEEAAERIWLDSKSQLTSKSSFTAGAKSEAARDYWFEKFREKQTKNKFSEEDMKRAYNACYSPFGFDKFGELEQDFQKWFETFKKK
jgi:hypothetical protein